jgi:hypothetical protein
VTLLVLLPLLFPDGQPVSPGWRRLGQAAILTEAAALAAGTLLSSGPIAAIGIELPFDNPLSLDVALPPFFNSLVRQALPVFVPVSVCVFALLANASLIQRWRQAGGEVRQQLKWFAYFLATGGSVLLGVELVGFLFYPALFESPLYYAEVALGWLGFPLVLGLAVFKYRLYAIDIVIRRTLIYGVVSLVLAVVYLGSVALLQTAVTAGLGRPSPLAIVVSTLLIAALFHPLRQRVQAGIDRRFYRRKYDAAQALARFAADARAEVDLDALSAALVAIVHETVQPAHAGLWLRGENGGEVEARRQA